MDALYSNEHSALAALCASQVETICPPEIDKFRLRLGNNRDLKRLVALKFNLANTGKDALVLCLDSFAPLNLPDDSGDDDKTKFIVMERGLCRDDFPILKRNNKSFDSTKPDKYAAFVLLRIRNPVSMFNSKCIEFEPAGRRVFFVRFVRKNP